MSKSDRKKRQQKRRRERKRAALAAENVNPWNQHTPYHWWRTVKGQKVDFWPSTRKAMWQGKVYTQVIDVEEFIKQVCEAS